MNNFLDNYNLNDATIKVDMPDEGYNYFAVNLKGDCMDSETAGRHRVKSGSKLVIHQIDKDNKGDIARAVGKEICFIIDGQMYVKHLVFGDTIKLHVKMYNPEAMYCILTNRISKLFIVDSVVNL
jgi:hypothetical protein